MKIPQFCILHFEFYVTFWAFSSAVERFSDKEEVDGPTPSVPTTIDLPVLNCSFRLKSGAK